MLCWQRNANDTGFQQFIPDVRDRQHATLNGNLTLVNNNIIVKQGATFSGPGTLIVPNGSHVVGENLANIGTIVQMDARLRPGNSEGIGRVQLFDFQESSTSQLFVELTGTNLGQFDRLVATGDVRSSTGPRHRHRPALRARTR